MKKETGKDKKKGMNKRFKIILTCAVVLSVLAFVIVLFSLTGKVTDDSAELETTEGESSSGSSGGGSSGSGGGSDSITATPTQGDNCAMEPSCSGRYMIGTDENDCPIYECPSCSNGAIKYYTCLTGQEIEWCYCSKRVWTCSNSPEQSCDYDETELVTEEEIEKATSSGGGGSGGNLVCPAGCICNGDTIACPSSSTPTETVKVESSGISYDKKIPVCPAGCLCTKEQIVCEKGLTIRGNCAMGCEKDGKCLLPGIRTTVEGSKQYCDIDAEWKLQKTASESCDNNFECETNLCLDGNCITHGFFQKIFSWFGNLFGGK